MKKNILILFLFTHCLYAQVGIGTINPDPSAALDINSTSSGLLIPKMTMAQRDAISSPATGLMVFQTDNTSGFYFYNGTTWTILTGASDWTISGNDIYNANSGNVGIGTTSPSTKLHLEDSSGGTTGSFLDGFEDTTLSPFSSGGSANWFVQSTTVNTGSNAAESGNINDSQTSYMEYNVTIPAGGTTLSFYYSVSSESGFDFLRFYISGVQQNQWSGTISYTQQSYTLTAGSYTLRWAYEKDSSFSSGNDAVYIDDISIDNVVISTPVLRIVDGTQANGYVLTSDANGNTSWTDPSINNSGDDGDWTISGSDMSNTNSGQVSVANSLDGNSVLYVENQSASLTAGTHGIQGVTNSVDIIGSAGVYGESITIGSHEIGVMGDYALWGNALVGIGWATSVGDIPTSGGASGETNDIGVFGSVNYSTGIGVYGLNYNSTGYAGYFDGNLTMINGTKNASVPTTRGNQLMYSMESPEIWFEDFGQAKLTNGSAHIIFDDLFLETVFIDNNHPMHVFLQEQGDCNGLFFIPDEDGKGFTVKEKQNGSSNITFSYRITAKRRFFQDHRFGVDPLQPFENNLIKAKYVTPRSTSLEEMQRIVNIASSEKNSQRMKQSKKKENTNESNKDKK